MTEAISFFVQDEPKPGGSKTAFVIKGTNRAIIVDACKKNKSWRASVRDAAIVAMAGRPPFKGQPIKLSITFVLRRPKNHYRTGKNAGVLRDDAPLYHVNAPDATKFTRSTEDAMKGVVWYDDCSNAILHIEKRYSDDGFVGAKIEVTVRENNLRNK